MQIAGRKIEDWLEDFSEKITDGVNADRIDEEIIGVIHEEDPLPNYIYRTQIEQQGHFTSVRFITETCKPIPIRVSGPIERWVIDPQSYMIDFLLDEIARLVSIHERLTTIQSLIREAKEFPSTETRLTKRDVKKASVWIESNGNFADTLLFHPLQKMNLIKHQELIPIEEKKGKRFCGFINALHAYWLSTIDQDMALIYEKRRCHLRRTPVKVRFDDYNNPKELIAEEDRIAWFTDKTASAKIHYKSQ